MTLMITVGELNKIACAQLDRFEVEFNDIPMYMSGYNRVPGETHRNFIEDDGREYRVLIFKDTKTGKVYDVNYVYHSEFGNDYIACDGLVLVQDPKQSMLYVEVNKPEPVKEVKEVKEVKALDPVLQEQKNLSEKLKAQYYEVEENEPLKFVKPDDVIEVPVSVINDLKIFIKTKKFNLYQLQGKVFKICIDYKLEQKSFWQWFQIKIGNWKA